MNCYHVINENECPFSTVKRLNSFTAKNEYECLASDDDLINYYDAIFCRKEGI